jgi:hypothetical protein
MTVLFILELLLEINIDVRPSTDCTGMDSVPLPCSAALWTATSSSAWGELYKQYRAKRKSSGPLKYGYLREAHGLALSSEGLGEVEGGRAEDLGAWCEGVDDFGAVVLMVSRGV